MFRDRIDVYAVLQMQKDGPYQDHIYRIESIHLTPQTARQEAERLKGLNTNESVSYWISDVELKR